jgi:glycosyltransferase involved in cell wall biosynthesis
VAYASFLVSSVVLGFPRLRRPDVVVATSPQILCGLAGWILSVLLRAPFVLEVRDLWPDSIVAVGAIRNRFVIRLLRGLEEFLYARARRIVVVTDSFRSVLIERGEPPEKILVVKNGVDLGRFDPTLDGSGVRAELGIEPGTFVVSYVGTVGMAHGIGTLLEAAKRLEREHPDVLFLVIGEGAERAELEERSRREGLSNLRFLGQQPRERIPGLMAASDVGLVLLRDLPLFRTVIPSKLFEFMGMARPILLGVGGEARSLLEAAGAGEAIAPEDSEELARAIVRWRNSPGLREGMGSSGRRFVEGNFDRNALAERYRRELAKLLGRAVPPDPGAPAGGAREERRGGATPSEGI